MPSPLIDSVPPALYVPHADHRVEWFGIEWDGYEQMLAIRGDNRRPRIFYLDGAMELMAPSFDHEVINRQLGQVITQFCYLRGITVVAAGCWTLKDRIRKAGAEPDDCFVFAPRSAIGDRPDLVLEVIWTSGGVNKLEIYRRLGVKEVWFWDDNQIAVHVLGDGGYERMPRSSWLPDLDLDVACKLARLESMNQLIDEARKAFAP